MCMFLLEIVCFVAGMFGVIVFLIPFMDKRKKHFKRLVWLRILSIVGFGALLMLNLLLYIMVDDPEYLISINYPGSMSLGIVMVIAVMIMFWKSFTTKQFKE